jgi:hypothetical protein
MDCPQLAKADVRPLTRGEPDTGLAEFAERKLWNVELGITPA